MNVDDRQENGPDEEPRPEDRQLPPPGAPEPGDEEPTAEQPRTEGPQAPAADGTAADAPSADAPSADTRPRLTRSRSDRVIAGVCGGLGRYFNLDPVIFRIAAVALAFIGGAGLLLYLAAVLLMPADDSSAAVTQPPGGRNRALVIAGVVVLLLVAWPFLLGGGLLLGGIGIPLALLVGVGVLVWWLVSGEGPSGDARDIARRAALGIGVLIICAIVAFGGFIAAAAGPAWVVPALVIGAGAAILAGAFLKPIRWLILPAVALALAAGTVSAAGIDLSGGVGDRDYRPASAADLKDRYKLGVGELVVDLSHTNLPRGDVPLKVDLGIGEARLVVPDKVCVATTADVGMGNVNIHGHENSGVDVDFDDQPDAPAGRTRILLDANVGVGELRVHDPAQEADYRDGYDGPFDERTARIDGNGNAGCVTTGQSASG